MIVRLWELFRCSLEGIRRARLRSLLTTLGIAIASGSLVCMVAFVLGLREQIEAPIERLGLMNNIEVRPRSNSNDDQSKSSQAASPVLDDEMIERLESIPGVDFAYPDFRLSQITVSHDGNERSSYAVGLPREAALVGYFDDLLVAGKFFSLGTASEAILGEKMLEDLGFASAEAAIGQQMKLEVSGLARAEAERFAFAREQLQVRVVGVYRPPSFATHIGAEVVLLPVDTMRDLPGTLFERGLQRLRANEGAALDGYPQVVVRVKRPGNVMAVSDKIEDLGFRTRSVISQIDEARRFFIFMELLLTSVGTVALSVAGLGILNTMLMTVMERHQEIGLYKAMGASDGDVRFLFLTEAALIGFLGGLGGLVLARLVGWGLEWAVAEYLTRQGVEGPMATFRFPLWLVTGSVAYAIVVSIVSALYPASRAARVDPIQALRGE